MELLLSDDMEELFCRQCFKTFELVTDAAMLKLKFVSA
jgi:hypothetical protein